MCFRMFYYCGKLERPSLKGECSFLKTTLCDCEFPNKRLYYYYELANPGFVQKVLICLSRNCPIVIVSDRQINRRSEL